MAESTFLRYAQFHFQTFYWNQNFRRIHGLEEFRLEGRFLIFQAFLRIDLISTVNSQAPEPVRGPAARFARSGENGEDEVRSL